MEETKSGEEDGEEDGQLIADGTLLAERRHSGKDGNPIN